MRKNLFIALEGIDGSGKSTQAKMLAATMQANGHKVYATFEPTDRPIGAMIRQILRGEMKADDRTIAGLFVADRLDHLLNEEDGIVRKLSEGFNVITDRYYFSSYAYHGTHMNMDWVIAANAMSADILRPDVNIFIDVPPAISMQRVSKNRSSTELYETLGNLEKVREKFEEAFVKLKDVERIVTIDGSKSINEIAENIWDSVKEMKACGL